MNQEALPATGPHRPSKHVFAIIERDNARSFFTRIGAAWTNRDGSLTVRLDALPLGGVMQLRDPEPPRVAQGALP